MLKSPFYKGVQFWDNSMWMAKCLILKGALDIMSKAINRSTSDFDCILVTEYSE